MYLRKKIILAGLIMSTIHSLNAADWLYLQGVEPEMVKKGDEKVLNQNTTPRIVGFISPQQG